MLFEPPGEGQPHEDGRAEDEEVARRVEVDVLQVRDADRHDHTCSTVLVQEWAELRTRPEPGFLSFVGIEFKGTDPNFKRAMWNTNIFANMGVRLLYCFFFSKSEFPGCWPLQRLGINQVGKIEQRAFRAVFSEVLLLRCVVCKDGAAAVTRRRHQPKSTADEPPMIGSGIDTKTAPNLPRSPKKMSSSPAALITHRAPTCATEKTTPSQDEMSNST